MNSAPAPTTRPLGEPRRRGRPRDRASLTLARLRALVRLVRDGSDGSVEAVRDLLEQERDTVAALLDWEEADVPRPGEIGAVATFTRRFRAWEEARREARSSSRTLAAPAIAQAVAEDSVRGLDGYELGLERLGELVASGGFDVVGFQVDGEVHRFGRLLLRGILGELEGVRVETLHLVPSRSMLVVGYRTTKSRGVFRLVGSPPEPRRVVVVVDLDAPRGTGDPPVASAGGPP